LERIQSAFSKKLIEGDAARAINIRFYFLRLQNQSAHSMPANEIQNAITKSRGDLILIYRIAV